MPNKEFDPQEAAAEAMANHKGFYGYTRPRGRPVMPMGERTRQASVTLQSHDFDTARELGGGNVSVGIRRALSLVRQQKRDALAAIKAAAEARLPGPAPIDQPCMGDTFD